MLRDDYGNQENLSPLRSMEHSFRAYVKRSGLPFTYALIWTVSYCANKIENFRYRFLDGKVVLFDKIDTAFTWLDEKTELFKVVNVPFSDNIEHYCAEAKQTAEEQRVYFTGPSAMISSSFLRCRGSHTDIYRIRIRVKKTTLRLFSIGVNITNVTEDGCFRFRYRRIIRL